MSSLKSIIFYISVILLNYHLVTSKKMNVTESKDTFVSVRDVWDYFNKGGQKGALIRDLGMGVLHIIHITDKIYDQFEAQQTLDWRVEQEYELEMEQTTDDYRSESNELEMEQTTDDYRSESTDGYINSNDEYTNSTDEYGLY